MTHNQWRLCSLIFIAIVVFSQLIFSISQLLAFKHSLGHALAQIETRVAIDSAYLDLGDPTTQQTRDSESVQNYINALNYYISNTLNIDNFSVISIAFELSNEPVAISFMGLRVNPHRILQTDNFDIHIKTKIPSVFETLKFNWFGLLLGIVVALFIARKLDAKVQRQERIANLAPRANLRIDLNQKQLVNIATNESVSIQNKPLCFFTALIEFCIQHPDHDLLHHKDVPLELVSRANKTFGRLIELGHTKRKRPDFNANLEKTLSEIRTVLDMVFSNNDPCKQRFYPPRAQGEGSRSKQHSYALTQICRQDIEILGM
jgi:uncharacterized membrane protein